MTAISINTPLGTFEGATIADCLKAERKARRDEAKRLAAEQPKRDTANERARAAAYFFLVSVVRAEALPRYDLSNFTGNGSAPCCHVYRSQYQTDLEAVTKHGRGTMAAMTTLPDAYLWDCAGHCVAVIWDCGKSTEAVHAVGVCDGILSLVHVPNVFSNQFSKLDF